MACGLFVGGGIGMQQLEFAILYAIQNIHTNFLNRVILTVMNITGSYGQLWIILAVLLLFFKKTRKAGFTILISYAMVFVVGQYGLKDLIARPRPCHMDETVALLVSRPSSFSCPSTHSAWAFAAAASIFAWHKKFGIAIGVVALIVAFGRLYLFVHFPTDVLFGIALGILFALVAYNIVKAADRKIKKTVPKTK